MAQLFNLIFSDEPQDEFIKFTDQLLKIFQSCRINFLIGAGASQPAINVAGNIEKEVSDLYKADNDNEATNKLYSFLQEISVVNSKLSETTLNGDVAITHDAYKEFIKHIETILTERKTKILPRQVNIISTNYDLFVERVVGESAVLNLNDGFKRTANYSGKFKFSASSFFTSQYSNGNLYNYKVELPSINLLKLHGSLSWSIDESINEIIYNRPIFSMLPDIENKEVFLDNIALVLPRKHKFEQTVLQLIYYDLLRLFANELDRENVLLMSFGFSFADEHIYEIVKRSLKNPTLKLIIFAYNNVARQKYSKLFADYNNVTIVYSGDDSKPVNFNALNRLLASVLPSYKEL
ncbi:MAG: SIR2 family protein [Paraglaciecola sp.]|uniref:SIR2 family protein n=1 Tax=Paraglaciecola sp. TaxID=1920173 RepID=UPI003263544D